MKWVKSNILFTEHAIDRMENRSIGLDIVEMLFKHGDSRPAGCGAERIFLPRDCVADVKEEFGADFPKVERFLDGYMILSADGAVITVAHNYKARTRKFVRSPKAHFNGAGIDEDDVEIDTAVNRKKRHRKKQTRH